MFDGIKKLWKGIKQMFGYATLKSIVGKDITLSEDMINAINEWRNMLSGQPPWETEYIKSLRIEKGICREFADAALVELETSVSNERLDKIYQKCIQDLNGKMQDAIGMGSMIIKPLGPEIVEYVSADKFIPIAFGDDGKPIDVCFLSTKRMGLTRYYTRFERHYFVNGNLTIENKCYRSANRATIGSLCELSEVPEWANINPGPITYIGMTQMDFGYYRNPLGNEIDGSMCGMSIFEEAKEVIKKVDTQAARLDWEFDSGERAIHVDEKALKKNKRGRFGLAKLNARLFRGLDIEDGKDKELLKEYSPEMRDEAYRRGLEEYKREIEFIVGLSYGDLSDVQQVEKTAEEVKVSKQRKYNRVTAIQGKLQTCLEELVAGLAFYNELYTSGYELNCKFHDSILTDEKAERQQDREDVAMGVMHHVEYRMKWYNEDEATAMKNLPEQNTVME